MSILRRMPAWLKLVLALAALLATYRESLLGRPLAPASEATARVVVELLHSMGEPVLREGTVLSHPDGFAYEIYFRCTGYLPVACLAAGMVACPASARRRLLGLAVGVPLLLALNLVRLVHLFLVGVSQPQLFPLAHGLLWEPAMALAVLSSWLAWKNWACRPPAEDGQGGRQGLDTTRERTMLVKGLPVLIAAVLGLAGCLSPAERRETARDPGAGEAAGEKPTSRPRDEIYSECLRAIEQARADLEGRPSDLAAQARHAETLATSLEELKRASQQAAPSASQGQHTAQRGKAVASPSGPVTPSGAASRKEDERRRRDATLEKFRSGPPLGPPEQETLTGVPSSWILASAIAALARVNALRDGLAAGGVDAAAIQDALGDVRAELEKMRRPQ